jgi:hypothetical protein
MCIQAVLDVSKKVELEGNTDKIICMLPDHNVKTVNNKSFENVANTKYFRTAVANKIAAKFGECLIQ